MERVGWILFGVLVGGGVVFGASKFHVVRATDGFYCVSKLATGFEDSYVDIRGFRVDDWNNHRNLALALVKGNRANLVQDTATNQLRETFESVFPAAPRSSVQPSPPAEPARPRAPGF